MKYIFIIFICLFPNLIKAQLYNRETNNNITYNDTTAKKEIMSLYNRLLNGEKFSDIAEKYSQDPGSYKKGGQLNPSTLKEYVDEYRKVVLALSTNKISKPFRTEYGYHIVQLICKDDKIYFTRHILLRVD